MFPTTLLLNELINFYYGIEITSLFILEFTESL